MSAERQLDDPLITRINICYEGDVVTARQQVRKVAELIGFSHQDQIRVATSVSELARNAYQYAKGGYVDVEAQIPPNASGILVRVTDSGSGIANLDDVLAGRYKSTTGLGQGLLGTRRLMDDFKIDSSAEGTKVVFTKLLPPHVRDLTPCLVATLRQKLQTHKPAPPLYELQHQNQELMRTLDELRIHQEEMALLMAELDSTNRGVLALHAELEERANYLRKIDELKNKFMSNMTHEFRTPLTSIIMLAEILIDGLDGPLLEAQEKQVSLIKQVAEELSGFVDDLLDLAKIEAGHTTIRPTTFSVNIIFDTLKSMLKPVTKESSTTLDFEYPVDDLEMFSDEGKISQVLRNFISNALKFTEKGSVRVSVQVDDHENIKFCIADTGVGIKSEHLDFIFNEFGQVDSAMITQIKSTGLGLSISRRLAELLGGKVWAESVVGKGSQFYLSIPKTYSGPDQPA